MQDLTAFGSVLVDLRSQLLGCWLTIDSHLIDYGSRVVETLEQWGVLASLDVEVVLTDDGITK